MKKIATADLRNAARKVAFDDLSGKIVSKKSGTEVRCLALDVSESGLKLIALDPIEVGTDLVLATEDKPIELQVVWCENKPGHVEHYICGVRMADAEDSLESLMQRSGMLKSIAS